MGTTGGLYFCFFDVNNIIKNLPCIRFDGCQHICLIRVFAHADFNSSTVEGFRIFVICGLAVHFIRSCNDFIKIGSHAHLVRIRCGIFPL